MKHDFITNIDSFTHKIIEDDKFNPFGTLIKKYSLKFDENKGLPLYFQFFVCLF